MTIIGEWKEKGYFFDLDWLRIFGRTLPSLIYIALRHPRLVRAASKVETATIKDLRPKQLPYELPSFEKGMKVVHSNERYLRPTLMCNPQDEQIVALAHSLGAFKVSEREFADAAHHFILLNIRGDFSPPKSAKQTLLEGHGTCIDKMNLFVALCRAAGVKARYNLYSPQGIQQLYDVYMSADPLIKKWYDTLGFFVLHGNPEAFVDGKWTPCDVSVDLYHLVAAGHPITRFGEDPHETMMRPVEESMYLEGLPLGFKRLGGLPFVMFKGTGYAINQAVKGHYQKGIEVLKNTTLEEYDRNARNTYKPHWTDSADIASRVLSKM